MLLQQCNARPIKVKVSEESLFLGNISQPVLQPCLYTLKNTQSKGNNEQNNQTFNHVLQLLQKSSVANTVMMSSVTVTNVAKRP
jgi:hypothetical protein